MSIQNNRSALQSDKEIITFLSRLTFTQDVDTWLGLVPFGGAKFENIWFKTTGLHEYLTKCPV